MTDSKPAKKYFTVVFEITNEENFTGMFAGPFTKSLADEACIVEGVKVVACKPGHAVTECDAYCKDIIMQGGIPRDVLVGYIQDEHPDRVSLSEAQALAKEVDPE